MIAHDPGIGHDLLTVGEPGYFVGCSEEEPGEHGGDERLSAQERLEPAPYWPAPGVSGLSLCQSE